jgi:hypothetical protein
MIVIGLLFAFSIVAVDTVGRRFSRRHGPYRTTTIKPPRRVDYGSMSIVPLIAVR